MNYYRKHDSSCYNKEDPVDVYPGCWSVYNSLPPELRDEIAVAIRLVGQKAAANVHGISNVISVGLFHPGLDYARNKRGEEEWQ